MLGFKGCLTQAIQKSRILAYSNALVEGSVNEFYQRSPNFSKLKRWQLKLDISHHWTAYYYDTLWASKDHDWYTRLSKSDHWYDYVSWRNSKVNCHRSRLAIYIKFLSLVVLLSRDQKEAIYSLLTSNKWPDQETKYHNRSVT